MYCDSPKRNQQKRVFFFLQKLIATTTLNVLLRRRSQRIRASRLQRGDLFNEEYWIPQEHRQHDWMQYY